jgi:hypothetical protein
MGEDIEFWPKIKYLLPFLIFSPITRNRGLIKLSKFTKKMKFQSKVSLFLMKNSHYFQLSKIYLIIAQPLWQVSTPIKYFIVYGQNLTFREGRNLLHRVKLNIINKTEFPSFCNQKCFISIEFFDQVWKSLENYQ